jgi:ATP-dependent RNA helicase DHX57
MRIPDPFAAKKAVEERQARAAQKAAELEAIRSGGERKRPKEEINEFSNCPEVRMAANLRELVEDAVKKVLHSFCLHYYINSYIFQKFQTMAADPNLEDELLGGISEDDAKAVLAQLVHLGFKVKQAQSALEFLSQPSSLAQNLLRSLTPLEAAIEYCACIFIYSARPS